MCLFLVSQLFSAFSDASCDCPANGEKSIQYAHNQRIRLTLTHVAPQKNPFISPKYTKFFSVRATLCGKFSAKRFGQQT